MIVSFVMTYLTTKDRPYLWFFYRCLDMAKKYGYPIIAQEEYFEKPSVLKAMGKRELLDKERVKRQFGYEIPSDSDLEKIPKYIISKRFEEMLIQEYGSINDTFLGLLQHRSDKFEELLRSFFREMTKTEPVECILTLTSFPSLYQVAEEYNAKVINLELGALRSPTYLDTGYFDENVILGNNSVEKRYKQFLLEQKQRKDCPVFTNKEILAIFMQPKYLKYIFRIKEKPSYEIGAALGTATWLPYMRNSNINDEELLWHIGKKYKLNEIRVRRHPGDFAGAIYPSFEYARDTSANTLEFILSCKKIVTLGSNLSIESKLLGRECVVYQKSAGYYMAAHDLEEKIIPTMEYLSFFAFGYMVPFDYLTDVEYIRWRLTNPPETEIYRKHLQFYLSRKNIRLDEINGSAENRYLEMLKMQDFDFSTKDDFSDMVRPHIATLSDYKKKISMLENELKQAKGE